MAPLSSLRSLGEIMQTDNPDRRRIMQRSLAAIPMLMALLAARQGSIKRTDHDA